MSNSKPSTSSVSLDKVVKRNMERKLIKLHETLQHDRIPVQLFINCIKLLMFKDSEIAESLIQKLEDYIDRTITMKDIDELIDDNFSNIDNMYVQSIDQLKTNVKTMIGLPGLSMMTPGIGSIYFGPFVRLNHQGSKQACLAIVGDLMKFQYSKNMTYELSEFLLEQLAHEMKYYEFVDVPVEVVIRKVGDIGQIMRSTMEVEKRRSIINELIMTYGNRDDMVEALCSFIFGEAKYHKRKMIEMKLRKKMDRKDLGKDAKYAIQVLDDYLFFKSIINLLKTADFLRSNYDISPKNLKIPLLPTYYFADSRTRFAGANPQQHCFVFRRDVEMYIMIRQKINGTYTDKESVISDNKFIECVSFEEAVREIVNACGNVKIESYITEQPEVGFYSAPPIVSPFNTLCKPVFIIFRDFFNFLIYELNILKAIKDENIKDLKAYVLRFFEEFQVTRTGLFCIDWTEFCKFLDEGRALFVGKLDENVERMYIPTVQDVKHGINPVIRKIRENVKPGILANYDMPSLSFKIKEKLSSLKNGHDETDHLILTAFLAEFRDLCIMWHQQNECHKLNVCAIRFHEKTSSCRYSCSEDRPKESINTTPRSKKENKPDVKEPAALKSDGRPKKMVENRGKNKSSRNASARSDSSTTSPRPRADVIEFQPVVQYTYDFRTCPILEIKTDVTLYNSHVIDTCLKLVLDSSAYQKVISRKNFKLPAKSKWFDWNKVVDLMENVNSVIPNHDNVLADIKSLRMLNGSAMMFETGKCIDWKNPNVISRSNENRKTSDLKQNWIKALPFDDVFYSNDSDKELFKMLMEYELDQLAATIGSNEVVTLKCPQTDLSMMMLDVKLKLKNENDGRARKFVDSTKKNMRGDWDASALVEFLKHIAFGNSSDQLCDEFGKVLMKHIEAIGDDNNKKQTFVDKVLYKIDRARQIRKTIVTCDKYGITKPYDKKNMKHIPLVRTSRNGTVVFEDDIKFALDVTRLLKNDKSPVSKNQTKNSTVSTFNYVPKADILEICQNEGFEDVPFEMIDLEQDGASSHIRAPILSPCYTLCIEARTVLLEVLSIMKQMKVLGNLDAKNIDTLTIFIDGLMEYFKPESTVTFCMDYNKAVELLERTKVKFANFTSEVVKSKYSGKKDQMEVARFLPSFAPMLSSLKSDTMSKKDMEEFIEVADIRTLMYEYPELAICYHNQKMCSQDGYCPLDYINEKLGYELPDKCNFTIIEKVENFEQKMTELGVKRLAKCNVKDSKNKLKVQINKTSRADCEPSGSSISIQTDVPLALDTKVQNKIETLENDIRRIKAENFHLKKENDDLMKNRESLKIQLKHIKDDHQRRERNLKYEYNTVLKTLAQSEKKRDETREQLEEQKKLVEELRRELEQAQGASTSTSVDIGARDPTAFFSTYIEQANQLLEAAKAKLNEFQRISISTTDKHRAAAELDDFEMNVNFFVAKAQKNLLTLKKNPNIDVNGLLKVQEIPSKPFSQLTYSKMDAARVEKLNNENPLCFCADELYNGGELFQCAIKVQGKLCNYECHQKCFDEWAKTNSTCPQCRRVVVDSKEFPLYKS